MRNRKIITLLSLLFVVIVTTACSSAASTTSPAAPASTTTLTGAALVQERCSVCHPLTFVEKSRHTTADWKLIVDAMISRGAQLTPAEETLVVDFLSSNFGQ